MKKLYLTEGKKIKIKWWLYVFTFYVFILWFFSLPSNLFKSPLSTVAFDHNGIFLGAKLAQDGQWRFPQEDSVPQKVRKCIITFEDEWFDYHIGVNPISITKAAYKNIRSGHIVSGGSTISMQVVRLSRGNKKRTFTEKFIEIFLATRLESIYSKDDILNLYISNAPFGGNTIGLQTASWRYFERSCKNLSWAEAATLAVLPNSPALIHPGKNRTKLLSKRNRLLKKLLNKKIIDEETYTLSIAEPLPDKPKSLHKVAPHLIDRLNLKENKESITTTIDYYTQTAAEDILRHYLNIYKNNDIYNIAAIIAETQSGKILAYCGNGAYNNENNNHVDMITASRSSGSTFKPFLFNAMLQEGELLPTSLVADIPIAIAGYRPNNYEKTFAGAIPAEKALASSLNIPAVISLREYGINKFKNLLQNGGITTLTKPAEHYGLTLILGGAECNLAEITSLYASMARILCRYNKDRNYCKADVRPLSFIFDSTSTISKPLPKPTLFHAQSTWQTMEALKELNRPGLPEWKSFNSTRIVAWKTGTSFGNKDAWAIGTTPEYTIGVWVGNADGEGRPEMAGATHAAPVMFSLFNMMPKTTWFSMPKDKMVQENICIKSGFRCGENCKQTRKIFIYEPQLESKVCPYHKLIHLTPDGSHRATATCVPVEELRHEEWFVLPPSMEYYYKQKNPGYKSLPPMLEGCIEDKTSSIMEFIYPKEESRFFLPKNIEGKKNEVIFRVAHQNKDAIIYWYVDNIYIGKTENYHENSIYATVGKHVITLTDNNGFSIYKVIEIIE